MLLLFRVRVRTEGKDVVSLARYQSVQAPTMRLGIKWVDVSHGFVGIDPCCYSTTARKAFEPDGWMNESRVFCIVEHWLVSQSAATGWKGMDFWTGHRGLFLRDRNAWTDKSKVYQ